MVNKLVAIAVTIAAFIFIAIFALIVFLGIGLGVGITSLFLGWWTTLGIIMIIGSIVFAIIKPQILIWVPILVIGIILVFIEYVKIF